VGSVHTEHIQLHCVGTRRICTIIEDYECAVASIADFWKAVAEKDLFSCPRECNTLIYPYTISRTVMSDVFIEFVNISYGIDKNELLNNFVHVQVFFSSLTYLDITVNPAYTLMALFSDVGGAFGLVLGATLLTLVEFIEFCFNLWKGLRRLSLEGNSQGIVIQ